MLGSATKLQTARKVEISGAVKGSASFDGSKNINIITEQNNIVIIQGKINLEMEAGSEVEMGQTNIKYPAGYTKDNCVIISIMARNSAQSSNMGYSYGVLADENYSGVINAAAMGKYAVLKADAIMLTMRYDWNATMSTKRTDAYDYKIILMKLPTYEEGVDYTLGDVNGDGQINNDDIEMIKKYTLHTAGLTTK